MHEDRIINLEIKYSHQEEFIFELNKVVIAQQKTIDQLEKELTDIKKSLNAGSGVDPSRTLKDDRPPHF